MKRIIINADDCGMCEVVNNEIEKCIVNKKITSTTIMANMGDFDGAKRLYDLYNGVVSFGWHINLTEGSPLRKSQLLLDKGFYKEENGQILFNGMSFWKKKLSCAMSNEIRKELFTQYEKIRDNGIVISHADSHQHIHTSPSMLFLMPELLHDLKIYRCRRLRNYVESPVSRLLRNTWTIPFKIKGLKMTDSFASFREFFNNCNVPYGDTIELMCHPGFSDDKNSLYSEFLAENNLLMKIDKTDMKCELITYKDL